MLPKVYKIMKSLSQTQYNLLLFTVVALWGSLYVGNRVILGYMPVLWLLFFRFAISAAVLIPITIQRGFLQPQRADWPRFLLVGGVGYFASNALLTLCTRLTNASLASLLNSLSPVFMLVFAYFMLGEKITPRKVIVIAVAIGGAAVIVGGPGNNVNLWGLFCAVASVVLWSFNSIFMKSLTAKYDPLTVTAYGMAVAAVFSLPTAFVESAVEGAGVVWALEPALWMAFVALVCTAFAHMMWNFCLAHQEAGHCAAFYPVQPMVSMLLGVVLLGEKVTPSFLLGSALIIFSVVLNSLPARTKGNPAQFLPDGLSTAAAAAKHNPRCKNAR